MKPTRRGKITDESLIEQAAGGDQEAFGDLYERYLDPIFRYIYYRVSTAEEAEDLTETVFLRAWETLASKKTEKIRNFQAWLYRIAHNLTVDHHRKNQPASLDQAHIMQHIQSTTTNTEEAVVQRLTEESLSAALFRLEEPYRNVIVLRFFNKLSHAETAEILGLTAGNVRVIQYRALKQLQAIMNEDDHD